MSALDTLKHKMKNSTLDNLEYEMAIGEAEQAIKNFCNVDTVPAELEYVLANMAADILRSSSPAASADSPIPQNEIGSISVGDVSISRMSRKQGYTDRVDGFINDYKSILLKFRALRW